MKLLWTAAGIGAVIAAGVLSVGAVFCARTLHVPRQPSAPREGADDVVITANDGAVLKAWWLRSSGPNGNCVIVLHGIADSRKGGIGFAPMFLESGYNVLIPDSRAHGASGGAYVTYGLLEKHDVVDWAVWMKRAGCSKLYGLGESLGASILIETAAISPAFSAIVAECPYADLREIAEYRLHQAFGGPAIAAGAVVESGLVYARWFDGIDVSSVSPVADIRTSKTPILLIHGLADDKTPPENSRELARANPANELWLVPGAGHVEASSTAPEEFHHRVLAWFMNH